MQAKTKPDAILKDYWRNNGRFADLFNQMFWGGEESLDPEKLSEKDTEESTVILNNEQLSTKSGRRDLIKQYEDGADLVLIGVENQAHVHYAMPIRDMLYEALRYTRQCKELENRRRKEKDLRGPDEFLSGIKKGDKIRPVITLVVYYGEKEWDGPLRLTDMMDIPPMFRDFVVDWSIHLLNVRDAGKLKFKNRDNQDFFELIGEFYSNNGKFDLEKFEAKQNNRAVYWETAAAIGAATGSMKLADYARKHKGGNLNMCTALKNLELQGERKGKIKGEKKGIKDMASIMRELNIDDETIIEKLQAKYQCSRK
jgi:hypothetical protein